MDIEPIIPFGKYKGQPITTLLADTKYLEWCKQQDFLKNYPIVYNICVNQTIVNQNENSKTPEHNKIQNLFLEEENQNRLIDLLFKATKNKFNKINEGFNHKDYSEYFQGSKKNSMTFHQLFKIKVEFETKYNWDILLQIKNGSIVVEFKEEYKNYDLKILQKYFNDIFNFDNKNMLIERGLEWARTPKTLLDSDSYNIYIEIKPLLGDDYPNVLRKMNQQKILTYCDLDKKFFTKFNKDKGIIILLVKDFVSSSTTKEQLIQIFNQSNIKVIFLKDIIEGDVKLIETNIDNISELKEYIIKLEKENTILKERLKQYETPTS
jgi:hypothetical protein